MMSQLNTGAALGTGVLVGGLSRDFADSTVLSSLGHGMGELKLALSGVMIVSSTDGHWVVPPSRALWLAPNVRHKVRMLGKVQLRSVFVNPEFQPDLPAQSYMLSVSPLFRELISAVAAAPAQTVSCPRITLLMDLLLEQINGSSALPLHLPTPRDHRLARICTHIQEHLDDTKTLQEWAMDLGYDQRTLHRLFVHELGMSFSQWRQQAKLLIALEWLAEGRQVLSIALDLGYQNQSAFTAMFRRNLGITPSDFIRNSLLQS
ncbi:AraC family transcriptional regulator [Candidimonas sp. SYP-B2681]|uniref:AraC family transcriptional regulator n=1 Tax=Candidimonas sp. SYP-B2681 TaxID=2497686 RepID=UPI000F87653F|nr:helix-turn-helix transcriptional regulator [Candidimonas sp. SYP-B2681]RTZ44657.1 AraC family transcriptional regulator [Candidimonas sp. SYP-B2681]